MTHLQRHGALKNVQAIGQLPAQELRPGIEPGTFAFGELAVRRATTAPTQQWHLSDGGRSRCNVLLTFCKNYCSDHATHFATIQQTGEFTAHYI